ncbi:MAG: cytochrome c biogenesis protein ResB [Anaerolineae bacterium]|nr:cytochrome c biogenesis protein ResB [Anaerolineae bacterium]
MGRRLDVAAVVILVVLVLAAFGSCFPQFSPALDADPQGMARWEAAARAKYGALVSLVAASGVFRWFRFPVFLISLGLLVLLTLVCTLGRWRGVWRRVFHRPVRCSDEALASATYAAELSAPPEVPLPRIVREALKERGFHVHSETVGDVVHLRGDRGRLAPLGTLVTHPAVLLLVVGVVLGGVYGWREEVVVGPGEMVAVGHGSGLAVRGEGFAIARYPDGSAASYEAEVAVIRIREERVEARGRVRLNEPLLCDDISLVLSSYEEVEDGYRATLLAVRDPGYVPVVVAGFLLLFGVTVSFNFPHCWVYVRIERAAVRFAGRADRRSWGFEREFASLVRQVARSVIPLR